MGKKDGRVRVPQQHFCWEREEKEREKDGRCCAMKLEQDKERRWMFGLFSSHPVQETIPLVASGTDEEAEGPMT